MEPKPCSLIHAYHMPLKPSELQNMKGKIYNYPLPEKLHRFFITYTIGKKYYEENFDKREDAESRLEELKPRFVTLYTRERALPESRLRP